jgi:hypothetical protein
VCPRAEVVAAATAKHDTQGLGVVAALPAGRPLTQISGTEATSDWGWGPFVGRAWPELRLCFVPRGPGMGWWQPTGCYSPSPAVRPLSGRLVASRGRIPACPPGAGRSRPTAQPVRCPCAAAIRHDTISRANSLLIQTQGSTTCRPNSEQREARVASPRGLLGGLGASAVHGATALGNAPEAPSSPNVPAVLPLGGGLRFRSLPPPQSGLAGFGRGGCRGALEPHPVGPVRAAREDGGGEARRSPVRLKPGQLDGLSKGH